jgi:Trypsin Inhibitor like cysteine rich domain
VLCDNEIDCEQTCSNVLLGMPAPMPCRDNCGPGCDCANGFVRNDDGMCVAGETCGEYSP